ncbi:MAG: hypothetical protein Unbinned96contig1001_34 [Prokaryotic dsDNA virus sp.]|nr:MAG: hypothetical protein Unbinned96contig1001_34 [Prokaryotic dsDNA virus sp.]|tara:strand:- start:19949 stop:24790 length:4842 start_codon:yes stop_codon:yes gene_type:complete
MRIVEDQKEGIQQYPEDVDIKQRLASLKEEGFTDEQIKKVADRLPLNKAVSSQIEANVQTPLEGGRFVDEEPEADVVWNVDAQRVDVEEDYIAQKAAPDEGWELGFEGTPAFKPPKTKESVKELAGLVTQVTGADRNFVEEQIGTFDDTPVQEAVTQIQKELQDYLMAGISQEIEEAESPEKVASILERVQGEKAAIVNLSTLRAYSVGKMEQVLPERLGAVTQHTLKRIYLAQEISKRENELMANASFFELVGDFLEYAVPVVGVASEEYSKYKQGLPEVLGKLDKATPDQQEAILKAALDAWEEQESLLIQNNNSLMTAAQFSSLKEALLQGGMEMIEQGDISPSQYKQYTETLLNVGLEAPAILAAFGKGLSGLVRFTSSRSLSGSRLAAKEFSPELMAKLFSPEQQGDNILKVEPTTRKNSHVIDTEYVEIPLNKMKKEQEGGLKDISEKEGMSVEDVAARQLPTPTPETDVGFPNTIETRKELNDLVLLDNDATSIGMSLAREVERKAGTSLTPIQSATGFKGYSKDDNSIGLFTFLLGDGSKGGFKTAQEVEDAARLGLAGHDYRIVDKDGKWFAEVDIEHYLNPDFDVGGLYTDPEKAFGTASKLLGMNPIRVLGSKVLSGIHALKGVHRSRVQKIEDKFKASTKKLSFKQGLSLQKALQQGDLYEQEWTSLRAFKADTGIDDKKVFKTYREMRDIYEEIYHIRNKNYYNKLRAKNMKFVALEDDGNLGSILNPKSKDVKTNDGFVYDVETKSLVKADPDDGMSYVRLTNGILDEVTGYRFVVRMKPDRIKALPMNLLNKRKGHIDRFYRDTGWVVRKPRMGQVEGKEQPIGEGSTTHIVRTEAEAKRIEEETGGVASRARENDDLDEIFSQDDAIQFTYGSSHTKKRGEKLKGADGNEASILNVFETMGRTIASTQRALDYNMMQTLKARLYHEFGDMFVDGAATPMKNKAVDMLKGEWKSRIGATARLQNFENWHQYIRVLENNEKGALFKQADAMLSGIFDPILSVKGVSTDTGRAVDSLRKLVADLVVVWNPLYQIPQNLVPALYLSFTKGSDGVRASLAMGGLRRALKKGDYSILGKTLGVEESLAKEMIEELKSNGLLDAVGRSNDFLDLARGDIDIGSTNRAKAAWQKVKKNSGGLAYDASRKGQEGAISLMNTMSYMTEFRKAIREGKKFDAKTKAEVSFRAQKNLQSQNSMDMLWYQNPQNVFGLGLQFFQHMNKLFMDIVAEPQYRVITAAYETVLKRKFSEGKYFGREAGPYAESFSQALLTTVLTYSVFGLSGGMGENIGGFVEDKLRKNFPEVAESLVGESLIDGALNETINGTIKAFGGQGAVDITSTFGPAGFLDMMNDFIMEGLPSFNFMGVSGNVVGGISESIFSAGALSIASNIDTTDKAMAIAGELLEPIQGWKNLEKASLAYMFGQLPFASSLSGNARVEATEAVFMAANIQPQLVVDYFDKADFKKQQSSIFDMLDSEYWASLIGKTMLQGFARSLQTAHLKGETDFITRERLLKQWVEAGKGLVLDKHEGTIERMFAERALSSGSGTYEEYIKPYIQAGTKTTHAEHLRILEQKANSAEAKALFQSYREFYEKQDAMAKVLEDK